MKFSTKQKVKKIFAVIAAIIVAAAMLASVIFPVLTANAASASDLQKQVDSAKKNTKEAQAQLDKIKGQVVDVQSETRKLDQQISSVETSIRNTNAAIAESETQIAQTAIELEEAEAQCAQYDADFKTRARIMYENGTSSYLEVLFGAQSFSDFINRVELVKQIIEYDNNVLNKMIEAKNLIAQKKAELEDQKAAQELRRSQLSEQKSELEIRKQSKEELMRKLQSQQSEYAKALENAEKAQKQVEQQLKNATASSSSSSNTVYTGGTFLWPVPGWTGISSPFGYRTHPITGKRKFHSGIDIPASYGTSIVAVADGTVTASTYNSGGFGYYIIISHGSGLSTLYGHCSQLLVSSGQKVTRGQTIAKVGSTGLSTGNHCHFTVYKNGEAVNPINYLK